MLFSINDELTRIQSIDINESPLCPFGCLLQNSFHFEADIFGTTVPCACVFEKKKKTLSCLYSVNDHSYNQQGCDIFHLSNLQFEPLNLKFPRG